MGETGKRGNGLRVDCMRAEGLCDYGLFFSMMYRERLRTGLCRDSVIDEKRGN